MRQWLALVLAVSSVAAAAPANRWSYVDDSGVLRWRDDRSEIALFGVNYYTPFSIDFRGIAELGQEHKSAIERDVPHFTRMGLDAIRLHVFDREISDTQGNLLANKRLDLFDYLVHLCKRRGIYTVLTPIAWWGGTSKKSGFSALYSKPEMVLSPKARQAQTNYLRQFMNHVNPYTKKAYRDEPAIVAIELINEPQYADTTLAQITDYINALTEAVRSTGAKQPIFYNGWIGKEEAVAKSLADGCTFGWYPTGLVAGHCLRANYLPRVDDYPRMRLPCLARKAKIVYEFDAADVPGRVMYPAIARAFRSGGAQIATQFQYDPLPLAACNYGWQTHYLSLVYAPGKAVSFAIAAEAFRRTPRAKRFPPYPANARFGAFRLSYEHDLSEMVTEDAFLYSSDTLTRPPAPAKLERIVGCGSSPVVEYRGTGAYFLDRLSDGVWKLEVYPDAVWIADPHGRPSLQREVSRLVWRKRQMTVRLPNLGDAFAAKRVAPEAGTPIHARNGAIGVTPGAYVLARDGVPLPSSVTSEFYAPKPKPSRAAVWCEVPMRWPAARAMPIRATVASAYTVKRVVCHVDGQGDAALGQSKPYVYAGQIPGRFLVEGKLACWLEVVTDRETRCFPEGARPSAAEDPGPALVCQVSNDTRAPDLSRANTGGHACTASVVPGGQPGAFALRVRAEGFGEAPSCAGFRLPAQPAISHGYTTVCVRGRSIEKGTDVLELGLVQHDNRAYGCRVTLWPQWHDIQIPVRRLRPLWKTKGGRLDPSKLKEVSFVFGAWLYGNRRARPHGFEIERVWLERTDARWQVEVSTAQGPVHLFVAGEHKVRVHGQKGAGQTLAPGRTPGSKALRAWTKGFGPPPSCLSFRREVGTDMDVWRDALKGCDTLHVVARAGYPQSHSMEVVLLEADGAPWGKVVALTEEWREIVVPLSDLRFFKHWRHPEGRGGERDRFLPGRAAAVNVCFGAWLYGKRASEPHAIEVESVALVKTAK